MSKIDTLTIEVRVDEQIEKLEMMKKLLTEIKQLKEEVFGKQETKSSPLASRKSEIFEYFVWLDTKSSLNISLKV